MRLDSLLPSLRRESRTCWEWLTGVCDLLEQSAPRWDESTFQAGEAQTPRLVEAPKSPHSSLQLTNLRLFSTFAATGLGKSLQGRTPALHAQRNFGAKVSSDSKHSQPLSLLHRLLPKTFIPYAQLIRLDKPIGTWLLAWPCFWSIALAAPAGELPDAWLLTLTGVGALLLRGAGCTVNDLWDKDLDRQVLRTKTRPLASGQLTSMQALVFLGGQLLAGLGILLQFNDYSILLGASSLGLVFTYPLMKRITFWPQAYLGLTFNWGALLGWAAVHGSCDWAVVLPLYAGGVFWTLVYDTIYAFQDLDDDKKVGIKSTALRFSDSPHAWLSTFAALQVASFGLAGWQAGMTASFYAGLAGVAGHLAWQISTLNLTSRADCLAKFHSNRDLGAIMFTGIVMGKLLT